MSVDALEENILLQPRPRSFPDRQHWHPQEKWICLGSLTQQRAQSSDAQYEDMPRCTRFITTPANASAAPHMLLEALSAAIFCQDQSAGDVQ
jgi:hypothetical protein